MEEHVSPASKERVVQELAEHFAHDRLSLAEYERRVVLAYRATTADQLRDLTKDLAPVPAVRAADVPSSAPASTKLALAPDQTPKKRTFLALMSGVIRKGNWLVPARSRAIAFMGGVSLDLREATLTAPVTDIYIFAMMGGVEVIVPPDVRLESDGFAIMGGFEDQLKEPASRDPNAPLIRVHGLAIMGGVEARVAEPGEGEERKR